MNGCNGESDYYSTEKRAFVGLLILILPMRKSSQPVCTSGAGPFFCVHAWKKLMGRAVAYVHGLPEFATRVFCVAASGQDRLHPGRRTVV